jgi:hypothetical protein
MPEFFEGLGGQCPADRPCRVMPGGVTTDLSNLLAHVAFRPMGDVKEEPNF